jgi:osmotically-inducible protein OsmY
MIKANFVRVSALAICFVLLTAVGVLSNVGRRASASQSNPDCKNDVATRDRIMAALAGQKIADLKVIVKDGKVRVEGKVGSSSEVEFVKSAIFGRNDPCVSEGAVNTDALEIKCSGDQEIMRNVKWLLSHLACPISKRLTVSVKNGVATITGRVPDERYKAYVARLVESADCVKAGVKNRLVVTAPTRFSGDCSRLSALQLQKMLEEEVRSRMPCGVVERAKIRAANGVVTLTGSASSAHRTRMFEIIRAVCPGFFTDANLIDSLTIVDPSCPPGAKSCATPEGEHYCCTGCSACPTY